MVMYEALKDSVFLLIPLVAWLLLSCILACQYFKDRNKRKLVFTIGIFVSAFSFYNPFIESIGATPFFPSSNWLFLPITLAVVIAALSSLFKVEDFKVPFATFMCGTLASAAAFFLQLPSIVQVTLTILFMATSIPILTYIFLKSHASADLYFLMAALCFLFEGLVAGLGTSIDIPVLLALFGVVFIGLMFYRPENVNPSSLPSFIILEKKLDEANHNLKVMEAKLLKAERLAAIGELAGIIGHDLRNPLQGIMGATHYLKSHAKEKADPVCLEMLNEIDDCILRADKIVNDLVEYSQVITLMPFSTNPAALTSKTLSQLKPPVNIEIVNQTAPQPQLTVDDLKIQRAFAAIIKNAFDAMPSGGKLTIKSRKSRGQVVFSFQDTGAGMTEETLAKLWTPLFTTKAQGMGFGLAVSKRFVEAHGGQIIAHSVLGKGTEVTVMLPQDFRAAS
ncbi:MAG: HAMP domain-containing histidine kinase [Candidatus Bathyarchaeota archaeon]|nr:HAMP domain-containing histidine kinase [Candidatus Bathyarchaeota archaeon]